MLKQQLVLVAIDHATDVERQWKPHSALPRRAEPVRRCPRVLRRGTGAVLAAPVVAGVSQADDGS